MRSLERFGERPCVISFTREDREQCSFARLVAEARQVSAGLRKRGLEKGRHVVLYAPGSISWITACFAVVDAGAVVVPVDSQMRDEELAHVLRDTSAAWLFTDRNGLRRLEEAGLDEGLKLVLFDAAESDRGLRSYFETVTDAPETGPQDTAVVFYTSGTTGMPKGVPLTHANLLANLKALLELQLVDTEDRLLQPLPLHHVYPFTVGLLAPLSAGGSIVLPMSLTGSQIMRALQQGQVTGIVSVPRFYAALYDGIETQLRKRGRFVLFAFRALLGLSRFLCRRCGVYAGRRLFAPFHEKIAPKLRFVASGGAALDPELGWKLEALGWHVASGYGLTETSPILTFNLPGEGIGSAGTPLPGVDVRIADPEAGQEFGEVQAKGANVFSGYLHLQEETREVFTEDGYFRTGDLGYFENGRLELKGRASTMIVLSGGENIQPDQIEDALNAAPHIREAAILEKDDRLVALVVPSASAGDQDEIERGVAGDLKERSRALPSHHRISDFALMRDPLPRTRLGKLRRHELSALFDEAKRQGADGRGALKGPISIERMSPEDRQLLDEPAPRAVWEWLAERFQDKRLAPDTNLGAELGIDSLEWLNLSLEIQKAAGVDLTDDAIARIEIVRDLLREAAEAQSMGGGSKELSEKLEEPEQLLDAEQLRWLEAPGAGAQLFGNLLLSGNRAAMRRCFGLSVNGSEHLPDAPCVLAPNHQSYLDAPALAAALPAARLERTYWSGWTGIMFKNWVMRAVSRATRVVPIDIERRVLSSLAFAVCVLSRGFDLVWFPEGAISADGELKPFLPGLGFVLAARGVPVVPVRIRGTHEALPRHRWWPRRQRISVTFGKPVDAAEFLTGRGSEEGRRELMELLHERVAAL